jgi:hypothetical protein
MDKRTCVTCGETFPRRSKYGKAPDYCPDCSLDRRTRSRQRWADDNPDKMSESRAKWLAANPEKAALAVKNWTERNAEYRAEYGAQWKRDNREKINQQRAERRRHERAVNPEKARADRRRRALKDNYGLTVEEYDAMWAAQGEVCAICKRAEPMGRGWHVDHCHDSSVVRGILCSNCNVALGMLSDDADRLRAAVAYLERFPNV